MSVYRPFYTLLLLSLVSACQSDSKPSGPSSLEPLYAVSTVPVSLREIPDALELSGEFAASENVTVKSPLSGFVQEILVRPGQRVNAGEILVRIENSSLPGLIAAQQAELREAEAELELQTARARALAEASDAVENSETPVPTPEGESAPNVDKAANPDEAASSNLAERVRRRFSRTRAPEPETPEVMQSREHLQESRIEKIKAELAVKEQQLSARELSAPFTGTVNRILLSTGASVDPGTALLELINLDPVELKAALPKGYLSSLSLGAKAQVKIPDLDESWTTAEVSYIDSNLSADRQSVELRLRLSNPSLRIKQGMRGQLRLEASANHTRQALLIPKSSLRSAQDKSWVYVVENSHASARPVELGIVHENLIEVKSGLKPNDTVVERGLLALPEQGAAVKVENY